MMNQLEHTAFELITKHFTTSMAPGKLENLPGRAN